MKPNILISGLSQFDIADLISYTTSAGTIPEEETDPIPSSQENKETCQEESKDKPLALIRRVIETPVANFIEATEFLNDDSEEMFCEPMGDYKKRVEAELSSRSLLNAKDGKIDVIWYCTGGEPAFMVEEELDFIRSAAGIPSALIVASPTIVSTRTEFKEAIDFLTSVAGRKRIVLAPSVGTGVISTTVSSGTMYLVEKTKQLYLDRVVASDEEKEAYKAAWTDYYGQMLKDWHNEQEEWVSICIEQAAGRALFILGKEEDVSLTDLIAEGVSLFGQLIDIIKDDDEEEPDKPEQSEVVHTAALMNNIVSLIYEIAACYGVAATQSDVELILGHSDVSDLPQDAAAITYAVGMVAKACFVPDIEYGSDALKSVFFDSKIEGKQKDFKPFDDDNPFDYLEEDEEGRP